MSEKQPDERDPIQKILKAGGLYFALVWRWLRLWHHPHSLDRPEFRYEESRTDGGPIMFAITVLASRWVVRRLAIRASFPGRIAVGLIALGLLLLTEFAVALWIRGLTIAEYLAGRDPVAGAVFVVLLAVFALMPLLGSWGSEDQI